MPETARETPEEFLVKQLLRESPENAKAILRRLDKNQLIDYIIELLAKRSQEDKIPISVLATKKLGAFEATVKYLKEDRGWKNNRIAGILNRSQQAVWTSYSNSKNKHRARLVLKTSDNDIPLRLLSGKESILRTAIIYLHEQQSISFSEIAQLLNRDKKTIWATYNRRLRK